MTARSVLGRMVAALALMVGVLLATGAVASATPGIDPFRPVAAGPVTTGSGSTTGTSGTGSSTGASTGSSSGSGTSAGGSTTSTTSPPSATASAGSATSVNGGSLPMTGSHTLATFVLGLIAIFLGAPLVRAGRRWFDARHWPAC